MRHAWRRLRRTPGFAAFAVVTLALAIGAISAIYAVIRAVMAPPPGIRDHASIANVYHYPCCSVPIHALSWDDYLDLRDRQTAFRHLAAWGTTQQTMVAGGTSLTAFAEVVSGNYFEALGVTAALGRVLQPHDDGPDAARVVVLSHGLWQRLFGGAADVVGRTVQINGTPFEVVGVAPREFKGMFNGGLVPSASWVPLEHAPLFPSTGTADRRHDRERRWLRVFGRLNDGRTLAEAQAETTVLAGQIDEAHPIGTDIKDPRFRTPYSVSRRWAVRSLSDTSVNIGAGPYAAWLGGIVLAASALVLLVACSNLANLMLARGAARRQEVTVRLALGAVRWRLVRGELAEGLILASAGGLAGLLIARVLTWWLSRELNFGNVVLLLEPRIDARVFLVAFAASGLSLLVAGLIPAWQSTRADVRTALAADATQGGAPRWRGRRLLITAQVAVSVILLAMGSLFLAQLSGESRIDTGLRLDRVALAEVDFSQQRVDDTRVQQVVADVLSQLSHRPDVASAAASSGLPFGLTNPGSTLKVPDRDPVLAAFLASSPSIFETLGVSVIAGRAFDARDTAGSEPVVVLNETAARQLFDTIAVVGRQVEVTRRRWVGQRAQAPVLRTIIGVASDSDSSIAGRRDQGVVYLPIEQQHEGRLVFSARAADDDPVPLVGVLRQTLRAAAPDVGVTAIGTGEAMASPPSFFAQVGAGLSGVLGALALVLAMSGLYGVLSQLIERRTREIGVRVALGASRPEILRLIIREGLSPVVLGLVAGAGLGWIAHRSLQGLFTRLIPGIEWVAFAGVAALLLGVGWLACYIPARRAARVSPNVALRAL